ncbi:MAG: OmpA family protein [Parachlamydiales bacterium]
MKRLGLLLCCLVLASGCQRSCGDVWQDTKTCGRHVGRGVASLFGKQTESRQIEYAAEFLGPRDEDFIPLSDESLYQQILIGDSSALLRIDADTPIPQSSITPPGIEAFVDPKGSELANLFANLHFETDQYVLKGNTNLATTRRIADYLKKHPTTYIYIEGHCDERGPAAYNMSLGARRSNAVRNELIKLGVDLNQLFTVSYGKERPIVEGHDGPSWAENRRAQFKVYAAR